MLSDPNATSRLAKVLVVILGLVVAVLIIILWNIFATAESSVVLLIVIAGIAFAAAGFLAGFMSPGQGWRWGLWLNLCAVGVAILTILTNPVSLLIAPFFLGWTVAVSSAFAAIGARLRGPRRERPADAA